ncbi:hypothetical protein RUMGNA_03173 [Mediterraneibacter gnavus ATCC 29149]|uniref:Uncharacterized protein n=1 Tax=Mediterraneibacter gnavus (strain ATCC 29149 / DSM 114966 / JCM 6515 / VPI C7-9) TaxID=411470 RepID=A7B6G0_MEDG7|nr:hypothetical protein RUMGNA_03173 [Mediterraneibacter gnavus ATCC 29149]
MSSKVVLFKCSLSCEKGGFNKISMTKFDKKGDFCK